MVIGSRNAPISTVASISSIYVCANMRQTMHATVRINPAAVNSFTPFLSSTRPTTTLKNAPGRQPMVEIAAS